MGGDRLLEPPYFPQGEAEVVQRHALAVPIAGFPVDGGGILERDDPLVKALQLAQGQTQVVQCLAFAVPVAGFPVDGEVFPVRRDGFLEPPRFAQATPRLFCTATYRVTVFASQPVSCAADQAHPVRSYASKISMISLPDLVTDPSGPMGELSHLKPIHPGGITRIRTRRSPGDLLTAHLDF